MTAPNGRPNAESNSALALIALLEERLNTQEELLAQLTMAYTELASGVEAIMVHIMEPYSPEQREAFRHLLAEQYANTMRMMQEASRSVGLDAGDAHASAALFSMDGEQPPA